MNWSYIIADQLSIIPESIIIGLLAIHCIKLHRPVLYVGLTLLLCTLFDVGLYLLYAPDFAHYLAITTVAIVLICTFSRERVSRKVFFLAMLFVNTLLCEVICATMQLVISGTPLGLVNLSENFSLFLLLRGIYMLLYVPLALVAASLWDKAIKKAADRTLLWFILLPISQWVMLEVLYVRSVDCALGEEFYIIYTVSALVFLLADGIMYFAIRQLNQKQALEQKNTLLEQQLSAQLEHYQYILDDMERVGNLRHDLRSQLTTAYALLDTGRGEEARALLDSFSGKLTRFAGGFCENKIVDAIMAEKAHVCNELGVALDAQLEAPENISIERAELCGLFANILDNAIAAAKQTPAPSIQLKAGFSGGFFIVREKNTAHDVEAAEKSVHGRLSEHGRGLSIITGIAEKYGGEVKTERLANSFRITVWLKIS